MYLDERLKEHLEEVTSKTRDHMLDAMIYGVWSIDNPIFKKVEFMPERYIINNTATILFWKDGTKTVVKRSDDDEHNPRLAFLTAYFQKFSGLSKNKANKYLDSLVKKEQNHI